MNILRFFGSKNAFFVFFSKKYVFAKSKIYNFAKIVISTIFFLLFVLKKIYFLACSIFFPLKALARSLGKVFFAKRKNKIARCGRTPRLRCGRTSGLGSPRARRRRVLGDNVAEVPKIFFFEFQRIFRKNF